jgi:copper chaperone CopZ
MGVVDIAIVVVVAAVVIIGARRAIGAATGRRDCCSGDAKGSPGPRASVRVADADESHYPYSADLLVSGMSCERCARRVAGALNSIEGTWATVDHVSGRAHVLSKGPVDLAACELAVREAGYRVVG